MMRFATLCASALAAVTLAVPLTTNDAIAGADQLITVTFGNQKENIGNLFGTNLYNAVTTVLSKLCPDNQPHCTTGRDQSNKITIPTNYLSHTLQLQPASTWVWIENSNHASDDLRKLLISTAATSAEAMVDRASGTSQKNCGYYDFNNRDDDHTICNIGDFIGVSTPGGTNILDVHFEADHPNTVAHFDCVGALASINTNVNALMPQFGSLLGGAATSYTLCPNLTVS